MRGSCVAMHSKTKLERHFLTFVCRHIYRPSGKPVEHIRACIDVVGIVVSAVLATINRIRSARPLRTVSRTFKAARHTTCCSSSLYVAHTAAKAHGIGSNYAFLCRRVGDNHPIGSTITCIKVERSEVHPRTATHLLIDAEQSAFTFMHYYILRIAYTLSYGLIAHINGIATRLRNGRLI